MSGWIWQHVWPIEDESRTRLELIATAQAQLASVVDQANAIITGPPMWEVHPAAAVVGWEAYAPGTVLVARVPVEPASVRRQPPSQQVDEQRIEQALRGQLTAAELTTAERCTVVAQLVAAGETDRDIGVRLHWSASAPEARNAVNRFRRTHGIQAGNPRAARRRAAA